MRRRDSEPPITTLLSEADQQYFSESARPWPSLVVVLPLLITFELCSLESVGIAGARATDLVAVDLAERPIRLAGFGQQAAAFRGLILVTILLGWHLVARHRWRFAPAVIAGQLCEGVIWAIPLIVLCKIALADGRTGDVFRVEWAPELLRGIGSGLYEEFIFRLIVLGGLTILLTRVVHLPATVATVLSVIVSSALFAAHYCPPLGAEPFDVRRFAFRMTAGAFLGGLFICRGFGITAGCHVMFNLQQLVMQRIAA